MIFAIRQLSTIVEVRNQVPHEFEWEVLTRMRLHAHLAEHLDRDVEIVRRELVGLSPAEGAEPFSIVDDGVHDAKGEEHSLELTLVLRHVYHLVRRQCAKRLDRIRSDV